MPGNCQTIFISFPAKVKLKLSGDMGKAMALEKMMKKMPGRGFHTSAYRGGDVSKLFDDVKGVLDEGLVKKVNAVYAFKVEGKLRHWYGNMSDLCTNCL